MSIHRFDSASLPAMPWKNGGGTTREIVCIPPVAGMDDFDWRVSIATIAAAGPFSAFAGVDRVIMLLDGEGVRLHSGDGRIDHRLDVPHVPFAFAGDAALGCDMLGGTSIDFNLMARRDRLRPDLRVLRQVEEIAPAEAGLLMALRGRWRLHALRGVGVGAGAIDCAPGEGVWWNAAARGWLANPLDADAALAAVRLDPTATNTTMTRE